ncbi:MAG: riboflavin kinase [Phycisphaerales bacterium]
MTRSAIAIGNFDGVHLGHRRLVELARKAVGLGGRVRVLSFDPHPIALLRPEAIPARLSTFEQRSRWLQAVGADVVERLEPAGGLLSLSPEDFIGRLMAGDPPSVFVEGQDFRFGHRRSGTVATLAELGRQHGFRTIVADTVEQPLSNHQVVPVSSTRIRSLIADGRMRDAAGLLGRPYELDARTVSGEQRGRTIGVPTANLDPGDQLLPADGVYAGEATDCSGRWHPAAISVGSKPTFGGERASLAEVHLVSVPGEAAPDAPLDAYDWPILVRVHDWIRPTMPFSGVDALVAQLGRDIDRVRRAAADRLQLDARSRPAIPSESRP